MIFLAATCGGTIRGNRGRLTLPSYPGQYPNNLDCKWQIIGPLDHYLVLWFDELSMPYSDNCTAGDYVAVTEEMPLNGSGRTELHFSVTNCISNQISVQTDCDVTLLLLVGFLPLGADTVESAESCTA